MFEFVKYRKKIKDNVKTTGPIKLLLKYFSDEIALKEALEYMEENNNPNYFGILPANVRYDKKLKPMEKILYTEITALANSKGYCYATNSYFANLYDVHKNTAGTWINKLEKLGYIKSKIIYETGTKNVKERQLFIITPINEKNDTYQQKDCDPINKKIDTPINEIIEDNNTRYNNTRYNNKKINKFSINQNYQESVSAICIHIYI